MGQLKFKDLYLGKIDAYNEFLEFGPEVCSEIFFEYPNLDFDKMVDGSVYYICGDKGTGKTMLLKYIEARMQQSEDPVFTEFVRFKKDVDEDQRNQIKRASLPSQPFEEIIEKNIPTDVTINCVLAWQIYLIKLIVFRLNHTEYGVFDREDKNWKQLNTLLNAVYNDADDDNVTKRILPKVKKGNIELNIGKYGKVDFELEWTDSDKKAATFTSIAKKALDLYAKLIPKENKIYILVDELELSLKRTKSYERDITLIRDLIFAIQYISEISKEHGFPVYLIAAVRNEVYKNVQAKGMEINKTIHDFSVQISWQQHGGDISNHPLLKMLEKRIQYSEIKAGLVPTGNVWQEYFVQTIGNSRIDVRNYILDQTWYKPRDIIRMFTAIQAVRGEKNTADQETFDTIRKDYSDESWTEFEESLTAKYSNTEVDGIRLALTGMSIPFELKDFIAQIDGKADTFVEVETLKNGSHKPNQILRDLYDLGVIGNYGKVPRFIFKGDRDIDPMAPLTIHYPLIRFFRASIINYKSSGQ